MLRAVRNSRRDIDAARTNLEAIDAALASTRSSLRWLTDAAKAVRAGDASIREHPLDLANHVAGASDKCAALNATIERLELEKAQAAMVLAEVERYAIRRRIATQGPSAGEADAPLPQPSIGIILRAE